MSDGAYDSYVKECKSIGVKPTKREVLELHEETQKELIMTDDTRMISVEKAKEFAQKAYNMGYKEAIREIAS